MPRNDAGLAPGEERHYTDAPLLGKRYLRAKGLRSQLVIIRLMSAESFDSRGRFVGALDVQIDLPLASIGSRALALALDMLGLLLASFFFMALLTLMGSFIGVAGNLMLAAMIVLFFLTFWGYFVACELLMGGQSPGKRLCGLRVVQEDGTNVGVVASLVRNLLRAVDFMPGGYGIGVLTMFLNDRGRRLGDLAAGTLVVREGARSESPREGFAWPPSFSPADVSLVEGFFRTADTLPPERRDALAGTLVAWILEAHPEAVVGDAAHLPPMDRAYLLLSASSGPFTDPAASARLDYGAFTARARGDWRELAELLERARREGLARLDHGEVERIATLHRRAISDFAFARTHFAGTEAETTLRHLAFEGHRLLATSHEPVIPRLRRFFSRGFPALFRETLPTLGASFALFVGMTAVGFLVTMLHEDFATLFLGPGHIAGLRDGSVWTDGVSKVAPSSVLSSSIMTNNMSVALFAWAGGILAGLFTIYVVGFNGLMFGSVLAIVWRYDLLDRLLAFISAHGPLELFLITVAGAAGLTLGRGLVVAESRPRAQVFRAHAARSVKLVIGTLPWFVLLGVVEGYVSPNMTIATSVKALAGLLLLAVFLAYALGLLDKSRLRGDA